MSTWEETKEVVNTIRKIKIPTEWALESIDEYISGLFSFSKFKVGQSVCMASTYPVNQKDSWGWMAHRHLFKAGSKAKIVEVDWRKGQFVYCIQFVKNTWIDDKNKIHESTSKPGLFYIGEKWLK